ncbi:leucine-rich repeat-containing protein 16a isoform x2 [Limosa lapponica baueri]|uniref:Leucine-rich repeat-containing protein 16a isoform x2 n=1 Tax=Limosa lapponica baueri TaxID=1758121 RepID=A0A2I0US66_LIMLA|nr:leucine-rich repeat-containing protein 16a isoform x2 [Limosa lapponica baueri]
MAEESSDVPKELIESVRDVIGRKIKISVKKKVKLETKGDKVDNKILCILCTLWKDGITVTSEEQLVCSPFFSFGQLVHVGKVTYSKKRLLMQGMWFTLPDNTNIPKDLNNPTNMRVMDRT